MEFALTGRTAVITGGGRGIGETIAKTFAEAGANIVVAARTEIEIESTIEDIERTYDVEGLAVTTDLRNGSDIRNLIERTVEGFGGSEILVNNAAQNHPHLPDDQTDEEIQAMMDVNLRAVYLLSRRWATQFRDGDAERGRIINISSNSSFFGIPAMTLYGATNAGVRSLTRGFAMYLAGDGVTVNSVTPGLTRIERINELLRKQEQGEIEPIYRMDGHPLGRPAEPEEVAYACLCLTHELADYINATNILVDGGLEAARPMYRV